MKYEVLKGCVIDRVARQKGDVVEVAEDVSSLLGMGRIIPASEFGVNANFDPASSSYSIVKGVFDNDYEAVNAGGTMDFAITRPRFYCRSADVLNVTEGDDLEVENVPYKIRVIMPDGTGMTELLLEKQ